MGETMSEISDLMHQPELTDREIAERIRNLLCQLHATIIKAKEMGLRVEPKQLHTIGMPIWVGFMDGIEISRKY
jgi:hypothetical protein